MIWWPTKKSRLWFLKGDQLRANTYPVFKDRLPTTEEPKTYSKNKSAEVKAVFEETGIQPTYHNHKHHLGVSPEEIDLILHEMDTRYIKLLLNEAHLHQGGGVPVEPVLKYKSILYATHIKDTNPDTENKAGYKFVEFGKGKVDFPLIFKNPGKIGFNG